MTEIKETIQYLLPVDLRWENWEEVVYDAWVEADEIEIREPEYPEDKNEIYFHGEFVGTDIDSYPRRKIKRAIIEEVIE